MARTASSAAAMLAADANGAQVDAVISQIGTADALRPKLDATVADAVTKYRNECNQDDCELRITVLVSWSGETTEVAVHVAPLPALPSHPVRVEVRGQPRSNAAAKNSSWVSERAPLEALMRAGDVGGPINELLLTEPDTGAILEGSQTNFFAIIGGKV